MTSKGKQVVVESSTMAAGGDCDLGCALPHDVMVPILCRLPVKSLSRFKCVCKTWRYLFCNPKFVKIHYDLFSEAPKKCSIRPHLLRIPRLGIDPTKKARSLEGFFMECCRGLFCMGRPLQTNEIILWNPATNLWKSLPLSKTDFGAADRITLGFGCSDEGDYKVVRIFYRKEDEMMSGVEVYSSMSDSWEKIAVPFKFQAAFHRCHAIVNGNPYWQAFIYPDGEKEIVLLGFNTTTMSFKTLPMSDFYYDGYGGKPYVDWKGSVGALRTVNRGDGWIKSLEVWVCDDATKVWTQAESFGGIEMRVAECFNCSRGGKIVCGCVDGRNQLFAFDPSKNCVVGDGVLSREDRDSTLFIPYNESLAFVKGMVSMVPMKDQLQLRYQRESPLTDANIIGGFFVVCRQFACYYQLAF